MTALKERILQRIAETGPLSVETYMAMCLGDPAHGYYMTRDPIGAGGDFTTAPEISQMFGEMLGVWVVNMWQAMGAPDRVALVELGPGRGTLMADMLRAAKIAPDFLRAAHIHLVETSPVLRTRQQKALLPFLDRLHWHASMASLPRDPALIIANEFFDALPIRQWQRTGGQWFERRIAARDDGALFFIHAAKPAHTILRDAPDNAVLERGLIGERIMADLAARLVRDRGAALIIDYGHARSGVGDTLQAVRNHQFADIFAEPGEADLTAHVDFAQLKATALANDAHAYGAATQGVFLRALGIEARAHTLASRASASQ